MTQNKFIIGLTGGSGCGKTTIANYMKSLGAYIIDCDLIAHDVIKNGSAAYNEILEKISNHILDNNKEINRRKLGSIVFNDVKKLKILNSITHSYIKDEVIKQMDQIEKGIIIIDAPLLVEANLYALCNEVWVCFARRDIQIQRIMIRDNLSFDDAVNRINLQTPFSELKKYANICIDTSNEGNLKKTLESLPLFFGGVI